jgi:cellulose synthase/poly-beta-1,6-N-acetylglucosamine synthase-like glycosyltransferase
MEALDWTYLMTAAAVLTERVRPATGMGNNMGIRREAYEEVGGYHGVRFSVTEDHALFHAVTTRTGWKARFPLLPELAVQTLPLPRLRDVYGQRRRWARGGLLAGPMLFGLYALVYFGTLAPLAAIVMAAAGLFPPLAAGAMVLAKCAVDFALFRAALPPERRGLLRALFAEEAFLALYFSTVPLTLVLLPRIRWKGRAH